MFLNLLPSPDCGQKIPGQYQFVAKSNVELVQYFDFSFTRGCDKLFQFHGNSGFACLPGGGFDSQPVFHLVEVLLVPFCRPTLDGWH